MKLNRIERLVVNNPLRSAGQYFEVQWFNSRLPLSAGAEILEKEIVRVLRPGGIYYLLELYPALYQNFLTRRLLMHPEKNRFNSADLRTALRDNGLDLAHTLEIKKWESWPSP
jgi:hypothetical protein